jgi:hydroxymethylglutaryl-CoA reductase (NADPH)
MRGSNLLPRQLRSLGASESWVSRTITSKLLSTSSLACQHPIHTLVVIALLASTSYIGLLQESLFDSAGQTRNGKVDVASLLEGGRTLELSSRTLWKWHLEDDHSFDEQDKVSNSNMHTTYSLTLAQLSQHLALMTFVFPDSSSSHLAPAAEAVPIPCNVTARTVPPTANLLSPISHESSLAFSAPWSEVSDFLTAAQEIRGELEQSKDTENKLWIMKAARSNGYGSRRTYRAWLRDGWTSFVDLIKVNLSDRFQEPSLTESSMPKLSTLSS